MSPGTFVIACGTGVRRFYVQQTAWPDGAPFVLVARQRDAMRFLTRAELYRERRYLRRVSDTPFRSVRLIPPGCQ